MRERELAIAVYVVNRHLVVLLETRESRVHREQHPRARKRYAISCTCSAHRRGDGHCLHTRAFLEDSVKPEKWRYITAKPMSAPDDPVSSPNAGRTSEAAQTTKGALSSGA